MHLQHTSGFIYNYNPSQKISEREKKLLLDYHTVMCILASIVNKSGGCIEITLDEALDLNTCDLLFEVAPATNNFVVRVEDRTPPAKH